MQALRRTARLLVTARAGSRADDGDPERLARCSDGRAQCKGAESVDHRTDIYSLGVTLYEMATGRVPFDRDSEYGMMTAHIQDPPPPPSAINPGVSRGLEAVILRALAKEPADRFQSASELRVALEKLEHSRDVPETVASSPQPVPASATPVQAPVIQAPPASPSPTRAPLVIGLVAAVIVGGILVAALVVSSGGSRSTPAPDRSGAPVSRPAPSPSPAAAVEPDRSSSYTPSPSYSPPPRPSEPMHSSSYRLPAPDPRTPTIDVSGCQRAIKQGRTYYMTGDTENAIAEFGRAVRLDNGNSSPHLWLSNAFLRAERWSEAEQAASNALSRADSGDQRGAAYHNICRVLEGRGQIRDAIHSCELSLRERPGNQTVVDRLSSLRGR